VKEMVDNHVKGHIYIDLFHQQESFRSLFLRNNWSLLMDMLPIKELAHISSFCTIDLGVDLVVSYI
jgi:hypothetical protein